MGQQRAVLSRPPARLLLGQAIDQISDGVIVLDRSWTVVYINEAGARFIDRDRAEFVGRDFWTEFSDAVGSEFWISYQTAMRTGKPVSFEAYYEPLRGWFEVRALPGEDTLTLLFQDVSRRHAQEDERSALVESLQAALTRSRLLLKVTESLTTALSVQEVADAVTRVATSTLDVLFSGIALVDGERRRMRYLSLAPLPTATEQAWAEFGLDRDAPPAAAARLAQPYFHPDRAAVLADFPDLGPHLDAAGAAALAHVPLIVAGQVLGTMALAWPRPRRLDADERALILTLAGYAAQALQRSLLLEQSIDVATALQRAVLPDQLPTTPLACAARYRPAETGLELGGDWYDAFPVGDKLALVVGDVGGHGISAAAVMAQLRNAVRAYGVVGWSPGEIVAATGALLALTAPDLYATMVYLEVDPAGGVVRYANAGHLAPLVVEPDGTVAALFDDAAEVGGPLLGVAELTGLGAAAYPTRTVALAAGCTLVGYTDGLVEDPAADIGVGIDRLRAAVASRCASSPCDRLPELLDDVIAATLGGRRQRDDLCLLIAVDRSAGGNHSGAGTN